MLIGGAAINRRFGRRALFVEEEREYDAGVFYCKDAFEGLETMDKLQDSERREDFISGNLEAARADVFLKTQVGKDISSGDDAGARSDVASNNPVPTPPFWGTRVLRDIPIDEVYDLLDLDELYRLQWGARGSGEQYHNTVKNEFEPALARLKQDAIDNGWIKPQAVYGYFPAQSVGNDVVIYDPAAYSSDGGSLREIARFHFPRMVGRERLCLADYVRSAESGDVDVIPLQIVTVGQEATHVSKRFRPRTSTPRRSTRMASQSRLPKPSPNGFTGASSPSSELKGPTSSRGRRLQEVSATPGDTAHVPILTITPWSSSSFPPGKPWAWTIRNPSSFFPNRAQPLS